MARTHFPLAVRRRWCCQGAAQGEEVDEPEEGREAQPRQALPQGHKLQPHHAHAVSLAAAPIPCLRGAWVAGGVLGEMHGALGAVCCALGEDSVVARLFVYAVGCACR